MNNPQGPQGRKIIHIDMDAFYVSVELLKFPELQHKPIVVAGQSKRAVVATSSYEARKFGIHSAMPLRQAKMLCPSLIVLKPDFPLYRQISAQLKDIFQHYTSLVEVPSLDEAYLDVTDDQLRLGSATYTAQSIRRDIFNTTGLTASAGVAPNKFLAKIASDWDKPDGLMVIPPQKVMAFLKPLPLEKIPGVGKVTLAKMHRLGMFTVSDLTEHSLGELTMNFGKYGFRLHELARGIDLRPVRAERIRKQISAETTFEEDLAIQQMDHIIRHLTDKVIRAAQGRKVVGFGVVLKLKTSRFKILTRSIKLSAPVAEAPDLLSALQKLLSSLNPSELNERYRLVGIGLIDLIDMEQVGLQPALFA